MILDDILAKTRVTVETARRARPLDESTLLGAPPTRGFAAALRQPGGIACISEVKRRSPSAGWIKQDADAAAVARAYEAGGAAALSVLTDEPFFGGTLDDLRVARAAVRLPVLRKDFVVDPYQILEARAAGADAVLLIVSALDDDTLSALLGTATRVGLDTLVETHDAVEVERALAVGAQVIGINHRDLRTFKMDMSLAERLRPHIPSSHIVVAESGIRSVEDVRRMQSAGVDAILVGENLMRAPDPAGALRAFLGRA